MFALRRQNRYKELSAFELETLRANGSAMIVDVREPAEYAAEHIKGSVNVPLSRFDLGRLPPADGRALVLQCHSGARSRSALDKCRAAQAAIDTHLAGGLEAWKRAGLPVERG